MKHVDARKTLCPKPLILTKRALVALAPGESLEILVDNLAAKENVLRFLNDNGLRVHVEQQGDDYCLTLVGSGAELNREDELEYCHPLAPAPKLGDQVIVFANDGMGVAEPELTKILLQAFINTVKEVTPLPKAMLFYTRGVLLTLEDSPVLKALQELETLGVDLLICGACLDFFEVKEQRAVGKVSNMYSILEAQSRASHVIAP